MQVIDLSITSVDKDLVIQKLREDLHMGKAGTVDKDFSIERKRGNRHLTSSSALAIGIRRNLTNTAAADFGLSAMEDISFQTVTRCELLASGSYVESVRAWYAGKEQLMRDFGAGIAGHSGDSARGCLRMSFHSAVGDATNSTVYQGRDKLHNLKISSAYLIPELRTGQSNLEDWTLSSGCYEKKECLADLQLVKDSTALGAYRMIEKQLTGMGCPAWYKRDTAPQFSVYTYTSDQGSDQKCFRTQHFRMDVAPIRNKLALDIDCAMHNGHLIDKEATVQSDLFLRETACRDWRMFNTLAKTANLWREHSQKVFRCWADLHGARSGLDHAKAIMPKCLASRFGSSFLVADRLDDLGKARVLPVFKQVLKKRVKGAKEDDDTDLMGTDVPQQATAKDQLRFETHVVQEHRRTYNRWAREVLVAFKDELFWIMLRIQVRFQTILDGRHGLQPFLMKVFTEEQRSEGGSHMMRLVSDIAVDVMTQFEDVLVSIDGSPTDWYQPLVTLLSLMVDDGISAAATQVSEEDLNQYVVVMALLHASSFHRRIYDPVHSSSP